MLCNLADQLEIKQKLSTVDNFVAVLAKILTGSTHDDILSRATILIADVASFDPVNKVKFAQHGCLPRLLNILATTRVEDLLINTVNAVEVICGGNVDNQTFCAQNRIFISFIDLLGLNSGLVTDKFAPYHRPILKILDFKISSSRR